MYEDGKLVYHGETKDHLKHGYGCLYTDQFVYEGEFKDDTMYGHGQITYGTNVWVGEFNNDIVQYHYIYFILQNIYRRPWSSCQAQKSLQLTPD